MATSKAFVMAIIFAVVTLLIFSDVSARQLHGELFSAQQTQSVKQSKAVITNSNPASPYRDHGSPVAGYPATPLSYYLQAPPTN